jgi:hypothetical protein
LWHKRTSAALDGLVVELDGVFLETEFRLGFISMGLGAGHAY